MQTIWKGVKTVRRDDSDFRVIMHYPESEEMKRELAKRVAAVHAQTVMEKLSTLSCPVEQKAQLLDAIIAKRRGHTR